MVGDDPPFHVPVFALTQHPRKPAVMEGGTTFSFVTDGIESALEQARAAAEDRGVALAGGAESPSSTSGGLLDEFRSTSLPSCSGGVRLFADREGGPLRLEPTRALVAGRHAPAVSRDLVGAGAALPSHTTACASRSAA